MNNEGAMENETFYEVDGKKVSKKKYKSAIKNMTSIILYH